MKFRSVWFAVPLLLMAVLNFSVSPVQADTGPKPGMDFEFDFDGDPLQIISGQQLECQDELGTDCQPLEELGPQGFSCTPIGCSSLAYGYAPYHKLVVEFSDRSRESNVFPTAGFNSIYKVAVGADSLQVKAAGSNPNPFVACVSMPISLAVELVVAAIYLLIFHLPKRWLGWVLLVNLLTLPLVWFAFPLLGLPALWITILSEAFVFLVEALLLKLFSGGRLSWTHALALSLVMNAASYGVGLFINLP